MKITKAWLNRQQIIEQCRQADACGPEFERLIAAENRTEFENVLLKNFTWCVEKEILECWLPAKLPDCVELDYSYTSITSLPALPKCVELYCSFIPITSLPALPMCVEFTDKKENKMPVKRCQRKGEKGWKWGDSGKCYISSEEGSDEKAKQKARKQGQAVQANR